MPLERLVRLVRLVLQGPLVRRVLLVQPVALASRVEQVRLDGQDIQELQAQRGPLVLQAQRGPLA